MNRSCAVVVIALAALAPALAAQAADLETVKKNATAAWKDQKWPEAAKAYSELVKLDPKDGTAWHHLGYALHIQGKIDEALPAHQKAAEFEKMRPIALYNVACVHALKKEKDKAFEALGKAVEAGFGDLDILDQDTDMDALRDDPRFAKVVETAKNAPARDAAVRAFNYDSVRGLTRILYYGGGSSKGEVNISYGMPMWKEEYEKQIASDKTLNRRWRFGQDSWTVLDTNLDVEIGEAKLAPGDHYVAVERRGENDFALVFLDPKEMRAKKLDSFLVHKTTGGVSTPLTHAIADKPAEKLTMSLAVEEETSTKGTLTIRFGPHLLTAPVTLSMKP